MDRQRGRRASPLWAVAPSLAMVLLASACTEPDPPATQLAFIVDPPAVNVRAEVISPAVVVEVRDASGRRVTAYNGSVSLVIDTVASLLSGTRVVGAVAGVATFPGLVVNAPGGGYRLTARAQGLQSAFSRFFTVTAGPPAMLAFSQSPNGARVGAPIVPEIVVEVRDAGGYVNSVASSVVTISLAQNPAGGVLSGSLSAAAQNGTAVFPNVRLDRAGQGYRLQATSPGLVSAVTPDFHIRHPFAAVTAGYFHSCGLVTDGSAYCWGDVGRPTLVPSSVSFSVMTSGRDHRCALNAAGAAYCWGGGGVPELLPGGLAFASIAAGYGHTCGVATNGAAYCWGGNASGELGVGTFGDPRTEPSAIVGGHAFAQVSGGRFFSCGVTTANKAYCWGDNGAAALGTGVAGHSTIPAEVAGNLSFKAVSAGGFHACGLTTAGAAYCWGDNSLGQLGDGTTSDRGTPVLVAGALTFTAISAGNRHSCALTADGTAYCWGENADGMLGSVGPNRTVPVAVSTTLKFASIRAGRFHTCALSLSGDAYCWGNNSGRLLDGGVAPSGPTPVIVP